MSKLRDPVTVCIAASNPVLGAIVAVSDLKLSNDYASSDLRVVKFMPLGSTGWFCMFANSPGLFTSVQRHAEQWLNAGSGERSLDEIQKAVEHAYAIELKKKAARSPKQTPKIPLDLLVFGFDSFSAPHIFSMNGKGECGECDLERLGIIGAGMFAARGALYLKWELRTPATVEEMICDVCEAKFAAESAPSVGKSTFVVVLQKHVEKQFMIGASTDKMRELWLKQARRRPEAKAIAIVRDSLKPFPKPQ